jgi:hypothetical protein
MGSVIALVNDLAVLASSVLADVPAPGGIEQGPEPEDVKAGWTALVIFLLLALSVAVLGFSLVKQLRKAQAAKDAGLYGDEPVERTNSEPAQPTTPDER